MSLGDKVKALKELKTKKAELRRQLSELENKINHIEWNIMEDMDAQEVNSLKTSVGTVTKKETIYYNVEDKGILFHWAYQNQMPEIFQSRITSKVVEEFIKQEGKLPDGVTTYTKSTLSFRKS